jgi:N-acetylmuramoyl-L-alanine amidase
MNVDIVIDPGHGDSSAGASTAYGVRGPNGLFEKDVTLRIAGSAAEALGPRAQLTRRNSEGATIAARADTARRFGAAAFISIHANGGAPGERGAEVWVHERGGARSQALAESILRRLSFLPDAPPSRGIRYGALSVLTPDRLAPQTAACLVEVDFLTDPEGERRLSRPDCPPAMGRAVARGVQAFLRDPSSSGRRFGDADATPSGPGPAPSCAGWESDCESMAKKIAERFFYNYLHQPTSIRAQRIACDRTTTQTPTSAIVTFDNGDCVDVSWNPAQKTASALHFLHCPGHPDGRSIITAWCDYTYSCSATGELLLAGDACFP